MSGVSHIRCVVPEYTLSQSDFPAIIKDWTALDDSARARVNGFAKRVGVEKRSFVIPPTQVLELGGLEQRAKIFEELGGALLLTSAREVLECSGIDPSEITHLIFTSCSVPIIPTLDSKLVEDLGLSRSVTRLPVFQYGCAGGVFSLGLANQFAAAGGTVLVLSTELCSLVFQGDDTSTAQLVGTSLFADGACSVLVTPNDVPAALKIEDWQSALIPNSRAVMGYDLKDTGLHLRLDQSLPDTLTASFKELSTGFLARHGLDIADIEHWLFHPGSVRIVDMLSDSIGLRPEQSRWAADVLKDHGNMSSATILFVLERFLRTGGFRKGDRAVIAGVGPGLTVELILITAQIDAGQLNV